MKRIFFIGLFLLFGGPRAVAALPADLFFTSPDVQTAALSPSGRHVAIIRLQNGHLIIELAESQGAASFTLFSSADHTDKSARISQLLWLDDRYIALQFSELRKGIEDLLDTKVSRRLLVLDTQKRENPVKSVRTKGWLVHPLPQEAGVFLYAKSGITSRVYKINVNQLSADNARLGKLDKIDGGQFVKSNEISSVKGFAIRWFFDGKGHVKAVLNFTREGEIELGEFSDDGTREVLHTWTAPENNKKSRGKKTSDSENKNEKLIPIALAGEPHSFFCLDFDEEEERSVYKVNFAIGEQELIYETTSFKIVDLLLNNQGEFLGVQVLRDGAIEYEYVNDSDEQKNRKSTQLYSVFDSNIQGTMFLAYTESHNSPGEFLLLSGKDRVRVLGHTYPALAGKLNSTQIENSVQVEGLSIPYLLTLPARSYNRPVPLIVMPHGGPIGIFDTRYFDNISQFFAAQGFAVLRVNFRGSGGHSAALRDAGKREWGNKILLDIYSATRQVVARPEIDGAKICALGFSYGGYAAAMLLIDHPELFRCGATVAGVADINLYINNRATSDEARAWFAEHVGNPRAEYDRLKSSSPVYRVAELTRPLLIIHGAKDEVVDVEHAYRLKLMLEKYGKDFEFYIEEEGTHAFTGGVETVKQFDMLVKFVTGSLK